MLVSFVASALLVMFSSAALSAIIANPLYDVLIAAAGGLYVVALALELKVVKFTENVALYKSVFTKNLINNFTYLDTLIVLALSVAIGSFISLQIFGGLVIVAGVIIIAIDKD